MKSTLSRRRSQRIHLWVPDLDHTTGGIQQYSRFLLGALREILPEADIHLHSMHDAVVPRVPSGVRCSHSGRVRRRYRRAAFAAQILQSAVRERPDLIIATHCHFGPVAAFLRRIARIPYWVTVHGVEAWNITRPAVRDGLRRAELILPVSAYTRDRLLQSMDELSPHTAILPNTFDAARFRPGARSAELLHRYGIEDGDRILLTVARLDAEDRYKGYDRVIRCLPRIRSQIPDVRYLLVGDGTDRARVEGLITETGVAGCVTLAGRVADAELSAHYNLADAFVMPSTGEGFGIVFLEALSCGKPVIAGDRDGSIDALGDGDLGVLIDPGNDESLVDAVTSLLRTEETGARRFSPEWLSEEVSRRFGFAAFVRRLETLLDAPRSDESR